MGETVRSIRNEGRMISPGNVAASAVVAPAGRNTTIRRGDAMAWKNAPEPALVIHGDESCAVREVRMSG